MAGHLQQVRLDHLTTYTTRVASAKTRIACCDEKTALSRAFEIPAKQQNWFLHLLLHVTSAIFQMFFLKTMKNTATQQKQTNEFSISAVCSKCKGIGTV